ncbi:Opr family porin [Helicobacter anatolicus]|uniref:Opr family porin n=1 Tax=Helicobacter anatolicus TaxID=2905874 RepID=UPI001E5906E1|nr:Opr family porin [Helicobacter anatolicus]MCE3039922.1 Opr family porin [Helicobacter anatolicus]
MFQKLKFFSIFLLFIHAFAYDNIDEALKNGVTKGDIILFGDYQKLSSKGSSIITPNNLSTYAYLGNTGYILGNVRLGYTSGFYKNVRAAISFAAALPIYNHHTNLPLPTGNTDSQKDFFNRNQAAIGESFLEYFDGDTNIKLGRIYLANEWSNMLSDGFWFRNKTINKLLIEAFWAKTYGRIDYYQMTDFREINSLSLFGIANLGIKYDILDELLSLKAYSYFAPNVFTAFGTRINALFNIWNLKIGGEFGATYSIQHPSNTKNAYVIDTNAFINYKEYLSFKIGYIHTSKDSGMGNLNILGDTITPFFVWGGKAIRTQKNANLFYGSLNAKFQQFTFSLTYGTTSFGTHYRQNEIDFTTEIGITNNVFMLFNLLNTHLDSQVIPTTTQINGGIRLRF